MLLLLVVGVLAGVAVAGVCMEMDGISVFGMFKVNELLSPPQSQLPSQIVIGRAAAPANDSGLASSTSASAPALTQAGSPKGVQTAPTPAVVPGAVYAYPPDDHGGSSGGSGSSGHGGRDGRGG